MANRMPRYTSLFALSAMSHLAVASPAIVPHGLVGGVNPQALVAAPSLAFNATDCLQQYWAR